jgi:predicted N-acetyltransferase YhbS
MVVHESARGRGLAGELMRHAAHAARSPVVSLIATRFGFPVYEHLGYRAVAEVVRLLGPLTTPRASLPPGWSLHEMMPSDLPAVLALDRIAVGADRAAVLSRLQERARCALCVADARGTIQGSVLALPKKGHTYCGPLIATDEGVAVALIAALAERVSGPLRLDVPRARTELIDALLTHGLEQISIDPVMTLGGLPMPGHRGLVRSISFQAIG